ncbi:HTH-type transcriptional regulator AdhR [Clostridium saccharobutylicum]|uniref:MerR family transcriptional regulator n=1 Tax=Clostridium saccharobutylicum TaxID=169679 RepID=UPI000983EEFE|nr:MerR family transcriptional regulator [Clostridium saccharobutylicum]AQS11346.1 HTH-type transcriptional regulator AdhR [Clostridium saccharobutylicum]MBC2437116.1 MerR family transcriptional regulator [Clostridium saccharobutylicum]NSB88742.1 DNA-binding transcriptional MerR regulator [Clostridium saccharobutylicum]NYC30680.1 DNA-binding transcriptional MerR regulator [Clostridium saccharobutylicum]OOM15436.1 HTH-type transcriptional regulator AdhR [Clostridium saccharobutylicum]
MNYSIGEFSKITNLSIDTLRYYEKEGLITPERKENGRRYYCEKDVAWIEFIKRLKETKMPIKEIQKYAKMRAMGDCTMIERMERLIKHRTALKKEISKANENLQKLNDKIDFYKTSIDERDSNKLMR